MSFRSLLITLSLVASLGTALTPRIAHAANNNNDSAEKNDEDGYDFSWLDPDKKIYVVQNRKYLKQNRLELAISGGVGLGDAYRSTYTIAPRAVFYPGEQFGISVFGYMNHNSENHNVADLIQAGSGKIPAVRDVDSSIGAAIQWIPFYGKINMFNQILYLDWHFEVGVANVSTEVNLNQFAGQTPIIEKGSFMAFHWGTGQKFFITRNWAARLDFAAEYYKAPSGVSNSSVQLTSSAGTPQASYDNYYVTLGVSYTF